MKKITWSGYVVLAVLLSSLSQVRCRTRRNPSNQGYRDSFR